MAPKNKGKHAHTPNIKATTNSTKLTALQPKKPYTYGMGFYFLLK